MEAHSTIRTFFLVLAVGCAIASYINVPEPGLMDNFTIIRNKILRTAVPLATAIVRSHIECAKLCTNMHWKCFGANVRRLSTDSRSLLCEAFWVSLPDLSRLEDSDGDLYLNPGRPDYWTNVTTGHPTLSTNCIMCLCRESGCEATMGECFTKYGQTVCGPFTITRPFWCDGTNTLPCDDSVEAEYEKCTKEMTCATQVYINYLIRYEGMCPLPITCDDYSIIVSGGPGVCGNPPDRSLAFLRNVTTCCNNHGGC